jgi:hypothetical protein
MDRHGHRNDSPAGALAHQLLSTARIVFAKRSQGFASVACQPLSRANAEKNTAARLAAAGLGSQPNPKFPQRRDAVVLQFPACQFHAIAPRAPRVNQVSKIPDYASESHVAVAAAEVQHSKQFSKFFQNCAR